MLGNAWHDFAVDVTEGRTPANGYVVAACKRHLSDLEHAKARGLIFDEMAAGKAVAFIELLRHSKGEWRGQRLILAPWQRFLLGSLFGWKTTESGKRRFKRAYVEIPRKNGKSTLAAAVALYMLCADDEGAPECYTAATSRDQARIVFDECKRMVKASPPLSRRLGVYRAEITIDNQDAKLLPLHAESSGLDGLNMHCGVVDEYHEHRSGEVVEKLRTSTGARTQSLLLIITTAGANIESACYVERAEAVQMLDGVTDDPSLFAFIACIDEGADWTDEENWRKANPNLGVSRSIETLREEFASAVHSPRKEAAFKRYYLDLWTNEEMRWLRLEDWKACDARKLTPADMMDELAGATCYAGLDLSSVADLTAFCMYFPHTNTLLARHYMPTDNMQTRERRDRVPFAQWVREGWIIPTSGNTTDTDEIRTDINKLSGVFDIREIAVDRWNTLTIGNQLIEDGFTMAQFGQGYASMSGPAKELEKLVQRHALRHGNNPVLTWQASVVVVEGDAAENIKPSKAKSRERIDGIVASVMAIGRANTATPVPVPALFFV